MKKGFTLIELLVVVLIIGILAAVALPQYEKAVEKARAAEAFIILKNMKQAQDVYYLANNSLLPQNLDDLDIQIPGTTVQDVTVGGSRDSQKTKNFTYKIFSNTNPHALRRDSNGKLLYSLAYYRNNHRPGFQAEGYYCNTCQGDNKYESICKSLGGRSVDGSTFCGCGAPCYRLP